MREELLVINLLLCITGCVCRSPTSDAGMSINLSDGRTTVATQRTNIVHWLIAPQSSGFSFDFLHQVDGKAAWEHVESDQPIDMNAIRSPIYVRDQAYPIGLFAVGNAFSAWRSAIALVSNGAEQGSEFLFRIPGANRVVSIAKCGQAPELTAGAVSADSFWLTLSGPDMCSLCAAGASIAIIRVSAGGSILTTHCFDSERTGAVQLHPTLALGLATSSPPVWFSFDDVGVTWGPSADDQPYRQALLVPSLVERRALLVPVDGPWLDYSWNSDGGTRLSNSTVPNSQILPMYVGSFDGGAIDAVVASDETSVFNVVSFVGSSAQSAALVRMEPQSASRIQYDYDHGHLTWFFATEADDAGTREIVGQHLN